MSGDVGPISAISATDIVPILHPLCKTEVDPILKSDLVPIFKPILVRYWSDIICWLGI